MIGQPTERHVPRSPGSSDRDGPRRDQSGTQGGFTLVGLVAVVVLIGFLMVPLLRMTGSTVGTERYKNTQAALDTARDALIAYAASHNGCLPYAADYEGSLPDTGKDGIAVPGYADAGTVREKENEAGELQSVYMGDLPWRDLGLGSDFLDGEGLRIQYYVAKAYTTKIQNDAGKAVKPSERICAAGFRGFEYDENITYIGTNDEPVFVYYDVTDGIVLAIDPADSAVGAQTINGSLQDEGGGTFAIVENELYVTVTSTGNDVNVHYTISGTDKDGNAQSEAINPGPDNSTVMTTKKFLTVTSVITDALAVGTIKVGMDADRQLHWIFYDANDATPSNPDNPDLGGVGIVDWYDGYPDTGASTETPIYVFHPDENTGARVLHQLETDDGKEPSSKVKRSRLLSETLLEVRRGPDVINGGAAEEAVVSAQNVFVLIATGTNRNGDAIIKVNDTDVAAPRYHARDSNHVDDLGTDWRFYEEMGSGEIKSDDADEAIFSMTPNTGEADEADNGDDTLLVMSFAAFRAAMSKFGMNMEPVCFEQC
jgi:type II secretory pathway pseudopilin PulG